MNLPDTPFSQFTITATSSASGRAQFTEFTGPRLLQVFGFATAADGAVLANGTLVAESGGGAVFAADGTLQQYLGSNLKHISLPDAISTGWGKSGTVSPDQKVYLFNFYHDGIYVLDSQFNVVRFVDLSSNSLLGPLAFDCYFAIAPNGNIFCDGSPVFVFDPNGFFIGAIPVDTGAITFHRGISASNTGNILVLFPSTVGQNSSLNEYDPSGKVIHSMSIQADGRGLARDSSGNYAVLECCNPSTVEFFDENYTLLHTTILSVSGNYSGEQFFIDDAWNSYVSIGGVVDKYDLSGNLVWHGPKPNGADPLASSMAIDPATGDAYINSTNALGLACYVTPFSGGLAQTQFSPSLSPCHAIAIDQNSHIYAVGGSSVQVLDTAGNILKTLPYSQVSQAASIAIASDGTKFVLDSGLAVVHELDASDNYVGSFPVSLPSGATILQGEVAAGYDGTIFLGLSVGFPTGSSTPDTYVKKVTRAGAEIWSVGSSEANAPLQNIAVDTSGRVYLLRTLRLEVLDPSGNQTSQVDLAINGWGQPTRGAATSVGDTIYFVAPDGRVYAVSPN